MRTTIARLVLGAALLFILVATLTPAGGERQPDFVGCLICGVRGNADALVNLILYVPLGVGLALNGRTGARSIGLAALLSAGIEFAQIFIPGRDPSLGDVCFNTLGAAVGLGIAHVGARWAMPGPRTAARLSVLAALAGASVFLLTGWLLAPALPVSSFRAWYTAALPDLEWYHGRVLQTSLGSIRFGPAEVPNPGEVRRLLLAGAPLRILAMAGPRVQALGPLFVIEDARGDEIFLIGPDRDDLVIRYRLRATSIGLDQPDLRLRRAFSGITAGDTLRIEVRREPPGYCLVANAQRACGLGFTIGSGWALLYYPRHFPPWFQQLLGSGWVAGFVLLAGFWTRKRWESVIAVSLLGTALVLIPHVASLNPTPPSQWTGAATGYLLGVGAHLAAHRWQRPAG